MKIFRILLQLGGLAYFVWRFYYQPGGVEGVFLADPVTLLLIGTGTMAAGQIQEGREAAAVGKSQSRIANYNAALQEREAQAIEQKAKFESYRQAKAARRTRGALRTQLAASGAVLEEGAPELLEEEQLAELELENLLIGYEGRVKAGKARSQAELDRLSGRLAKKRGKAARKASYFRAGGTLLTGFGMAGMYPKAPSLPGTAKATFLRY